MKRNRWILGAAIAAIAALAMACGNGAGGETGAVDAPPPEVFAMAPGDFLGVSLSGNPDLRVARTATGDISELWIINRTADHYGLDVYFRTVGLNVGLIPDGILTASGTYTVRVTGRGTTNAAGQVMIQRMPGWNHGTGGGITSLAAGTAFSLYREFDMAEMIEAVPVERARLTSDSAGQTASIVVTSLTITEGAANAASPVVVWDLFDALMPDPEDVDITPYDNVVAVQGRSVAFTAAVTPSGASQTVEWDTDVAGAYENYVSISDAGVLSVGVEVTPGTVITVIARAAGHPGVYDDVAVTVISAPADVEITPAPAAPATYITMDQGDSALFTATVLPGGPYAAPQDVEWELLPAAPATSVPEGVEGSPENGGFEVSIGALSEGSFIVRATAAGTAIYGEVEVSIDAVEVYRLSLFDGTDLLGATYIYGNPYAGEFDFGSIVYDTGGTVAPLTVTVTNAGNRATGALTVALSGANAASFALGDYTAVEAGLAVGASETFTVAPNYAALIAGSFAATVTVEGEDSDSNPFYAEFGIVFEVEAQSFEITLSQTAAHAFAAFPENHTPSAALTVTVTNTGNMPTGALTVSADSADFVIGGSYATVEAGLEAGDQATFTVTPYAGLAVGSHSGTVTVGSANAALTDRSFDVSVAVQQVRFSMRNLNVTQANAHFAGHWNRGVVAAAETEGVMTVTVSNWGNHTAGDGSRHDSINGGWVPITILRPGLGAIAGDTLTVIGTIAANSFAGDTGPVNVGQFILRRGPVDAGSTTNVADMHTNNNVDRPFSLTYTLTAEDVAAETALSIGWNFWSAGLNADGGAGMTNENFVLTITDVIVVAP